MKNLKGYFIDNDSSEENALFLYVNAVSYASACDIASPFGDHDSIIEMLEPVKKKRIQDISSVGTVCQDRGEYVVETNPELTGLNTIETPLGAIIWLLEDNTWEIELPCGSSIFIG